MQVNLLKMKYLVPFHPNKVIKVIIASNNLGWHHTCGISILSAMFYSNTSNHNLIIGGCKKCILGEIEKVNKQKASRPVLVSFLGFKFRQF